MSFVQILWNLISNLIMPLEGGEREREGQMRKCREFECERESKQAFSASLLGYIYIQ